MPLQLSSVVECKFVEPFTVDVESESHLFVFSIQPPFLLTFLPRDSEGFCPSLSPFLVQYPSLLLLLGPSASPETFFPTTSDFFYALQRDIYSRVRPCFVLRCPDTSGVRGGGGDDKDPSHALSFFSPLFRPPSYCRVRDLRQQHGDVSIDHFESELGPLSPYLFPDSPVLDISRNAVCLLTDQTSPFPSISFSQ